MSSSSCYCDTAGCPTPLPDTGNSLYIYVCGFKELLINKGIKQETQNWLLLPHGCWKSTNLYAKNPKVIPKSSAKVAAMLCRKKRKWQLTAVLESWSCMGSLGQCCTRAGPGWRAAPSMGSTVLRAEGRMS